MPNATVRIEPTNGLSSLTITYTGTKDITVLITNNTELEARFSYKKYLLPDFLHAIDGYQTEEIDAGDLPSETVDVFLSVIRQVNESVDKHKIIGIDSNYILPQNVVYIQPTHELTMPARCELYSEKKMIDLHIIKNIAKIINNYITEHKPVPNFAKKTKAQYKKIKNFIYNITHLILTREEIDQLSDQLSGCG